MPKDDMAYLGHMLDSAKEATSLIKGKTEKLLTPIERSDWL